MSRALSLVGGSAPPALSLRVFSFKTAFTKMPQLFLFLFLILFLVMPSLYIFLCFYSRDYLASIKLFFSSELSPSLTLYPFFLPFSFFLFHCVNKSFSKWSLLLILRAFSLLPGSFWDLPEWSRSCRPFLPPPPLALGSWRLVRTSSR